jgi:O-antigen ligase
MTLSRAGGFLSVSSIAGTVVLCFRRRLGSIRTISFAVVLVAIGTFLTFQLLAGGTADQLQARGLADEGRIETYRSTANIISDHPYLGTGLGTFPLIFPRYRPDRNSIWGVWDRTHNTLLETTSEMGIPFALLVVAAWLTIVILLVNGLRIRKRDQIYPIIGTCVAALAISHSMIDFSLQITGFAIVALSAIGTGVGSSIRRSTKSYEVPSTHALASSS